MTAGPAASRLFRSFNSRERRAAVSRVEYGGAATFDESTAF
ncbi:hypothetical protein RSSM_00816 [Rhodopirellula sallentina SM41]|uniref:Uncharacterized protein n=1 Tax=Rhodopirellula sallentina SM41 TaxID=1263870 RepID=M5UP44_9BACT|nr:hypothetical protein RSSM_00816 [Rhodopirellula sallentina SM41]